MIPRERIVPILQNLLKKSQQGEVHWKFEREPNNDLSRYSVTLGKNLIVLEYDASSALDVIRVTFETDCSTDKGRVVSLEIFEEGLSDWPLVYELYIEADSRVRGWGVVLAEIEEEISRPGFIGK